MICLVVIRFFFFELYDSLPNMFVIGNLRLLSLFHSCLKIHWKNAWKRLGVGFLILKRQKEKLKRRNGMRIRCKLFFNFFNYTCLSSICLDYVCDCLVV